MVLTEERPTVSARIGKIHFAVQEADDVSDPRLSSEARVQALADWLMAQWRQEHAEACK